MLRLFLVFLIIFLIVRAFIIAGSIEEPVKKKVADPASDAGKTRKGVPKSIGEYVDYEEIGEDQS